MFRAQVLIILALIVSQSQAEPNIDPETGTLPASNWRLSGDASGNYPLFQVAKSLGNKFIKTYRIEDMKDDLAATLATIAPQFHVQSIEFQENKNRLPLPRLGRDICRKTPTEIWFEISETR